MNLLQELQKDLTTEYEITKKFIERYPEEKNDWKPHPKSMPMIHLAIHVVEIFGWPDFMLKTEYLDFAENPYSPAPISDKAELMGHLEKSYQAGAEALRNMSDSDFDKRWQLRHGGNVLSDWTIYEAIMQSFKQITHHRAQLGVYYRLNDIFVPGSYGPSADELEQMGQS